ADLLERVRAMPLPSPQRGEGREPAQPNLADLLSMPGGVSNTTHGENVKRGVGYAVGFKNIGYSEGFQDYSTARVRLSVVDGHPRVEVHTAAAEVGQGDRKSTRLNSSHVAISYAVFCLKKKKE